VAAADAAGDAVTVDDERGSGYRDGDRAWRWHGSRETGALQEGSIPARRIHRTITRNPEGLPERFTFHSATREKPGMR
jgi:hypothetical protein